MEESDQILFFSLKPAGCELPDGTKSAKGLSPDAIVSICEDCLRLINGQGCIPDSSGRAEAQLPKATSQRFRLCSDLALKVQQLGFKGELSFHQFLYPTEEDTRRLLRFLADKVSEAFQRSDAARGGGVSAGRRSSSRRTKGVKFTPGRTGGEPEGGGIHPLLRPGIELALSKCLGEDRRTQGGGGGAEGRRAHVVGTQGGEEGNDGGGGGGRGGQVDARAEARAVEREGGGGGGEGRASAAGLTGGMKGEAEAGAAAELGAGVVLTPFRTQPLRTGQVAKGKKSASLITRQAKDPLVVATSIIEFNALQSLAAAAPPGAGKGAAKGEDARGMGGGGEGGPGAAAAGGSRSRHLASAGGVRQEGGAGEGVAGGDNDGPGVTTWGDLTPPLGSTAPGGSRQDASAHVARAKKRSVTSFGKVGGTFPPGEDLHLAEAPRTLQQQQGGSQRQGSEQEQEEEEEEDGVERLQGQLAALILECAAMKEKAERNETEALEGDRRAKEAEAANRQLSADLAIYERARGLLLGSDRPAEKCVAEIAEILREEREQLEALQSQILEGAQQVGEAQRQLAARELAAQAEADDVRHRARRARDENLQLDEQIYAREEKEAELAAELAGRAPRGQPKRAAYVARIGEVIRNVKKQDAGIAAIAGDTRALQREANAAQERLRRVHALVDDVIFRDAKKDPSSKQAYKLLCQIHDTFSSLGEKVKEIERLGRQSMDLQAKLDAMGIKPVDVASVQHDLQVVRQENKAMENELQELGSRQQEGGK
eukprot:jgi/Mesen1/5514/ME000279S04721